MTAVKAPWDDARELEECSIDELKARVLAGDLASATLRVLADRQDRANNDLMYACRSGDTDAVHAPPARALTSGRYTGKGRTVHALDMGGAYKWLDVVRILLAHDRPRRSKLLMAPPH